MTGVLHIVLARKPIEGTIAENCLRWGCGALWIDGTRVDGMPRTTHKNGSFHSGRQGVYKDGLQAMKLDVPSGRFPANLILDGSEEVLVGFPQSKSVAGKKQTPKQGTNAYGDFAGNEDVVGHNDSGSASRFFFNFGEQESDE